MRKVRPRLGRLAETARERGIELGRDQLHHLRANLVILAQAGVATGLAWYVAWHLLHNEQPIFAPTIALGVVMASQAQRFRRTAQLAGGVVLGVAVGELFILFIGTGAWQVGVSVVLAVGLAVAVKGGTTLMFQAGATAVLLSALPPSAHLEFPRLINGAIGGVVGITVVILFLPLHPLRTLRRAASPTLDALADRLTGSADALTARDAARAHAESEKLREMGPFLDKLHGAVEEAREVVVLAPIRRPGRRAFEAYERAVDHLERAVRNSQPLIQRTVNVIEDDEPTPDRLAASVGHLASAVRLLKQESEARQTPTKTRETALRAVSDAGEAYAQGVGFSGSAVVAQVRTVGTDLVRATGVGDAESIRMVRRAVGVTTRARTNLPPA